MVFSQGNWDLKNSKVQLLCPGQTACPATPMTIPKKIEKVERYSKILLFLYESTDYSLI